MVITTSTREAFSKKTKEKTYFLYAVRKQAKNGLQSRSSENGKTAVWMTSMDEWHGRLAWMNGMDDWRG